MDAYARVGMPVNYRHWSYGKEFIATEKNYKRGHMGLAYEIVINSNPCISYLMEENTMADAGAGDRARRLRPQQLLQGQLPVPHVDRCVVDHRLPGLRQELRRRVRGAPRPGRGGGAARHLPRAAEPRRRPLPPARRKIAWRRSWPRARTARPTRSSRSTTCGARCRAAPASRPRQRSTGASPRSRRRTCCTSSRRTRRCWSPGSARSCASCARWRSTSTRSARRR